MFGGGGGGCGGGGGGGGRRPQQRLGFGGARGGEHASRAREVPNKWFPFSHMLIVADNESGKTTWLLWLLILPLTQRLLRMFYDEVIIISSFVRAGLNWDDSSGWKGFRDVYQISDDTDESPDAFF